MGPAAPPSFESPHSRIRQRLAAASAIAAITSIVLLLAGGDWRSSGGLASCMDSGDAYVQFLSEYRAQYSSLVDAVFDATDYFETQLAIGDVTGFFSATRPDLLAARAAVDPRLAALADPAVLEFADLQSRWGDLQSAFGMGLAGVDEAVLDEAISIVVEIELSWNERNVEPDVLRDFCTRP
jgi:hypothetical protein